MIDKICKHCNSVFVDESPPAKAVFCSKRCSNKYWYETRKDLYILRAQENYKLNKEKRVKQVAARTKERKKTDTMFRLQLNLRKRFKVAFNNNQKTGSIIGNLGCSMFELKSYLESKFQSGMTWDNYGFHGWHMDHIKPLVSFDLSNPEQFKQACHYSNLQPLWARDNLIKGGSYE